MFGWLLGLLGGALLSDNARHSVRARARVLMTNFRSLGNMTGKTKAEICTVVGPPSSFSQLPGGKTSLPVDGSRLSHCFRFHGEKFDGITHEFAS